MRHIDIRHKLKNSLKHLNSLNIKAYSKPENDKIIIDTYSPADKEKEAEISKTTSEFMEAMQDISGLRAYPKSGYML